MEPVSQMLSPRLACTPAELTWKAGVDVLVFGGTKNGLAFGEAVVFFKSQDACRFYLSDEAERTTCFEDALPGLAMAWIVRRWKMAGVRSRTANAMAERLSSQLSQVATVKLLFPREGNAVFAKIPDSTVARLRELGWRFYTDVGPGGGARLMCSWDTTEEDVDRFTEDLRNASS